MYLFRFVALGIVWIFSTFAALGDSPQTAPSNPAALKQLSLEQLSQIDVTTPAKTPQSVFQSPTAIYVITSDAIRRAGATSIPEALRLAPGVEVARIDSVKWSIGIRGFGTRLNRSVLVLMDGRTVYTPLFDGTYWEVQNTNMDDIDRIEVIRGPGATIWGPNAVDGVINIITKDSKDTQGVLASAGGGNEELGFGNVRYGGGNDADFHYRVYGMAFTRSPEHHSDHDNFDAWRNVQAGFRMDWNEPTGDAFTLQGDAYDELAGERVQATSYAAPYQQNVNGYEYLSGGNILGRWKRSMGDGNDVQVQMFYDRTTRGEPNLGEIRNTFDVDYVQRHRLGARNEVTWGLGVRSSLAHEIEVVSGLSFSPPFRNDMLYSGYLQDDLTLVEKFLTLELGSKLLKTNYTGFEAQPSARLLWTPTANQSVWAAFTHAVRTPSDSEEDFYLLGNTGLTVNGLPFLARFNANNDFRPEQMNGYELGYRRLMGTKFYIDLAGFYNHYHDLFDEEFAGPIFLEDSSEPPHYLLPARFGNGLMGYTKGVEVAPQWSPAKFWRLTGSYSFLHMNIGRAPGSGDVGSFPQINGSSPQHQVTLQSDFDLSKTVQLDLGYRYVSGLPYFNISGYSTGNARLAWRFTPRIEISMVGENLLQPYHFEYGGEPGSPLVGIKRSAYAMIRWGR